MIDFASQRRVIGSSPSYCSFRFRSSSSLRSRSSSSLRRCSSTLRMTGSGRTIFSCACSYLNSSYMAFFSGSSISSGVLPLSWASYSNFFYFFRVSALVNYGLGFFLRGNSTFSMSSLPAKGSSSSSFSSKVFLGESFGSAVSLSSRGGTCFGH